MTANDEFARVQAAFIARAKELTPKERDHARLAYLDQLRHSRLFTAAAKLVAWEIVQLIDVSRGYAWPSAHTLGQTLNITERTVLRAIEELARVRVIFVERIHRRENHYACPYFWTLGDNLSPKQADPPDAWVTKMQSLGDKNAGKLGDILSVHHPKNPYSTSPRAPGCRGRDAGVTLAAQLATELWRIAKINIHALTQRQRCEQIGEVQSWLEAGWEAEVIRSSAHVQMRSRRTSEPIGSVRIFKPKLEIHYRALSARRMTG
jgi:hypothetical protein